MKKNLLIIVIVGILIVVISIFVISDDQDEQPQDTAEAPLVEDNNKVSVQPIRAWQDAELTDVLTGENFKISELDKPVLLESFAVWCPTCTKQQKQIKELHQQIGDAVVSVSIDMDPNEDEDIVKDHVTANGFDWYYVVAPAAMTKSLIDEFGIKVVNAPSAPMILVCQNQSTRMLKSGVKDVDQLISEIEQGCQA